MAAPAAATGPFRECLGHVSVLSRSQVAGTGLENQRSPSRTSGPSSGLDAV